MSRWSRWSKAERAFTVEAYFSHNRSYVAAQRAFRTHFGIAPAGRVPARKSIVQWLDNFRSSGCVEKKPPAPRRTVTTPENVEAVRQALLRSPTRSARKHALDLGISSRSLRRILREHLRVSPSKQPKPLVSAEKSQSAEIEQNCSGETLKSLNPAASAVQMENNTDQNVTEISIETT